MLPNFGNGYIISFSRQLPKCCLINGTLYEHNDGFSPNARDVAYATVKTPRSTPFPCCCTEFMITFMTGFLQRKKAQIFFLNFFL